MAILGWLMQH